jgi:hypothetical protein
MAWVGLASTCAAAITGNLFAGRTPRAWSLHPRPRSGAHALGVTVGLGLVVYAVLYGVLFEATGRADLPFGVVAGAVHGLAAFVVSGPRSRPADAFRVWAMHIAYGGTAAFLYVTP